MQSTQAIRGYTRADKYAVLGCGSSVSAVSESNAQCTPYDRRLRPYLGECIEGGLVVDKRPALFHQNGREKDGAGSIAWSAPLVSPTMDPDGISRLGKVKEPMLSGLEGEFRTLAAATHDPEFTGMDTVGVNVYAGYWRKHGARIGWRRGDNIEWEDGVTEPIPPPEHRWMPQPGEVHCDSLWQLGPFC